MGVPKDKSDEPVVQTNGKQVANQETNGDASSTTPAASNGHVTPTEELNDFSRQINIDTKPPANVFGIDDADATEDAPPQVSPLIFSSPEASSSSTVPDPPPLPALEYPSSSSSTGYSSSSTLRLKPETSSPSPKFVGLVNQAMTCYLNSLLQALYMTPEFRNAMYNWEFDGQDESKSIPYQLQRLFLNLQTSPKAAVETTDLTRSFGWDSSEAWQQHDIQELCRVMFDALEHKFKGTKEADLINRLYEGKMIDYLKCLSCGTERTREDTFLDIPLPVKPFGSTVAFGSIEEALRAFIQPEILNGNNQYSCGKCEKKCDAHKGLKFSRFPYILTLHLKRFDFDYQTFHRIKLNDKVTFPQTLNLNGFLNTATDFGHCNGDSAETNGTTNENGRPSEDGQDETDEKHNGHTPMEVDDPEENPHNPETNGKSFEEAQAKSTFGSHSGPYMYELFAIMIHSGSASGGHYYVYIKDFESGNWLSFNDQCVSPITQEDIQKSFGGNAGRFHYSSAYTTSTNAYMLMYRQVDPARNAQFVSVDAFPEHIKTLQKKLKDRQELDTRRRTTTTATSITDYSVITTRVYHYDRERCTLTDVKIHISGDYYMDELLQRAYDRSLVSLRSLNCCRLVAFDSKTEQTLASIDQQDSTLLQDVLDKYPRCDFLLEERERDETFRSYNSPMLNARIYIVDIKTNDVEGPFRVPVTLSGTVADMKQEIRETMKNLCVGELRVALLKSNFAVILDNEKDVLKNEIDPSELCPVKLFVAHFPEAAKSRVQLFDKQLKKIAEKFDRVVSLYFKVPVVTAEIRNRHSIPDYIPPTPSASQVRQETVPTVVEPSVVEPPIVEPPIVEPPVVVKVEDEENSVPVPMEVCSESLDVKALSPETTISETTQSSSPSPEPGEPKEKGTSTTGTVKLVKKKSLTPKSSPGDGEKLDATKTKEKSPGTIRETVETKEVTVNGVTKKVRVVKRIVKKDPTKKVVNAETATNGVEAPPPSEAVAPEKSTTPTKVVKKAKVASKLAPKAVEAKATATAESVTVEIPKPLPKTELNKQKSPTPEVTVKLPAPSAEVSLTLPAPTVDGFAFLDKLADGEDAVSGGAAVQYFRAISKKKPSEQNGSNADDESNVIQVHVDKNMTISALTMNLEPVIQVSKDYFKINKSRTDTLRLHESVSGLADGEELTIELGRILQDGEFKYKVSHLKLSAITDFTEELPFLCEVIVKNNQVVEDAKKEILKRLALSGNTEIGEKAPEKFRLWTKMYQSLGQVCIDNLILGDDITLRKSGEFVLEEYDEGVPDTLSEYEDFVIFTRKWNPDTLILDPYEVVTLRAKSELKEVISERSGIPVENVEYARNMLPFPKMKVLKTSINSDMDWKSEPVRTSFENSRNGHVYFYRDKTIAHKELTTEELATINQEETSKRDAAKASVNGGDLNGTNGGADVLTISIGDSSSSSTAAAAKSRRKERALKIYLDSPVKAS